MRSKEFVTEQIDNALDCLKRSGRNRDEGIHEARVCVKKIRALLRLVKDSLGPASFESEDKAYRDTARSLSKIRDSAAMLEITDKLVDHFSGQLSKGAFVNVRKTLAGAKIVQGYLSGTESGTEVRLRREDKKYFETFKIGIGLERDEIEVELSKKQFKILWLRPEVAGWQRLAAKLITKGKRSS